MIDQLDADLLKWAKDAIAGKAPVSLAPPENRGSLGVSLYLLEIVDDPLRQTGGKLHLQPNLRYLVTADAGDPKEAHRLLAALLYAAMDHPTYEVSLDPISSQVWSGLNALPRPAFWLCVPLPHEWQGLPAKPVSQRNADLNSSVPVVPFYGVVLGPQDIPIMNARIELPNLYRSATTDSKGAFTLSGVPAAPKEKTLLIKARKRERSATFQQTGSPDQPVIIRFNPFEETEGEN